MAGIPRRRIKLRTELPVVVPDKVGVQCPGIKRAGNLFQDFLLGGAAGGRAAGIQFLSEMTSLINKNLLLHHQ